MIPRRLEKHFFWLIIILFFILLMAYQFFPLHFEIEINRVSEDLEIDPFLIAAIIKLESNFNEIALSHSGAFGLMQLMPETANWLANQRFIQGICREPLNNIELGSFYLKQLHIDFNQDFHHALNAYHMGPSRLNEVLENNLGFKKTTYTKRISLYRLAYKILYDGFLIYPGE